MFRGRWRQEWWRCPGDYLVWRIQGEAVGKRRRSKRKTGNGGNMPMAAATHWNLAGKQTFLSILKLQFKQQYGLQLKRGECHKPSFLAFTLLSSLSAGFVGYICWIFLAENRTVFTEWMTWMTCFLWFCRMTCRVECLRVIVILNIWQGVRVVLQDKTMRKR
jgi:hypothetical protein